MFQRLLFAAALIAAPAICQQTSVFATGLQLPFKITMTPGGTFIVSEAGEGVNLGRISLVNSAGVRQSLIEGLPSGPSNPELALIGPTGVAYRNRVLYIAMSEGYGLAQSTQFANAVAAFVLRQNGPLVVLPSADRIAEEFLGRSFDAL